MACQVFGYPPIDNDYLKQKEQYRRRENIKAAERAKVARDEKTSENKGAAHIFQYVEKLKKDYSNKVSTICIFYNATGYDLKFVTGHDWDGHDAGKSYPETVKNGQWGGFLHVHDTEKPSGTGAAVVYRTENAEGKNCHWMFAWIKPSWTIFDRDNTVYTEIRDSQHYESDRWDEIKGLLEKSSYNSHAEWNGYLSHVITGNGTTAVLEATLTSA